MAESKGTQTNDAEYKNGATMSEKFCTICSKIFATKQTKLRHIREIHSRQNLFKCTKCDKVFTRLVNYEKHIIAAHGNKKDRVLYKCDTCRKKFKQKENMVRHKNQVHLGDAFKCRECPALFARKESWYSHINKGVHFLKFYCDKCKKTLIFKSQEALEKHVIVKIGTGKEGIKMTCKDNRGYWTYIQGGWGNPTSIEKEKELYFQSGLKKAREQEE